MMFIVQPESTWRPPAPAPVNLRVRRPVEERRSWEDLAAEQQWQPAIIEYLRENWRGQILLWRVINTIVAEAQPEARWQVRAYTRKALQAMTDLVRQRRVMRYRKRWVAALELPHEVAV